MGTISQFWNLSSAGGGGGDLITSVFGRTGDISAATSDYDTLDTLDVTDEFTAAGSLSASTAGDVGVGTLSPTSLGAGTRNLEVDSTFLSVMRLLNSGTVLGTILAGFGQVSISSTGVVDVTFGTDGVNRLNLKGDGAVEWPSIPGHATEGWGHIATDGTFTRSVSRGNTTWVASADDFPTPVAGVITLPAGSSWIIIDDVDIGSNRIECAGTVTIGGMGAETSSLSASTLASPNNIISTEYTFTVHDITINHTTGNVAVSVDGTLQGTKPACDWSHVNFRGDGRAVELTDIRDSINTTIGVFGDGYYTYTSLGTLGFTNSIFVIGDGQCGICTEDAADIVTRRVRVASSAFVVTGTGIGLTVPSQSIQNSEGYILNLCNFSGPTPANYTTGILYTDDKARWIECRGITNSTRIGEYYWDSNATATTISTQGTAVKIEGTSTAGPYNQRFTHDVGTPNRAVYASALVETFRVEAICSIDGGNNTVYSIQGYLNGVTAISTPQRSTTNGSGRAEAFMWQGIVQLSEGDYIELWITNESSTQNPIVEDLSVQILEA